MNKPRVIKDFEKLDVEIQEQIKLQYPSGFERHLITFKNAKGEFVSALLFETPEIYYLVRMTRKRAQEIVRDDEDYNEDGVLRDEVRLDYSEKYDTDEFEGVDDIEDSIEDDSYNEDIEDEGDMDEED
jgi:hypothetical protein